MLTDVNSDVIWDKFKSVEYSEICKVVKELPNKQSSVEGVRTIVKKLAGWKFPEYYYIILYWRRKIFLVNGKVL